jgi:hypothetical protein
MGADLVGWDDYGAKFHAFAQVATPDVVAQ